MFRQFASFALFVALCGALWLGTATAQTPRRTLSQRLEQFREDIWGESADDDPDVPEPTGQPTPARPKADTPTPAKTGVPTLADRPRTADANRPTPATSSRGSSRRTAQPGYQAASPPDAPADGDTAMPESEPTPAAPVVGTPKLAKPREAARSVEATPAELTPAVTPRVARSLGQSIGPAVGSPAAKKTSDSSKHDLGTDVLFSGRSPVLHVEASGPRKVLMGKPAVFTVKLHNAGDVAANNVTVTVKIPPFAELVEAQPTAGGTRAASTGARGEPLEWKIVRLEAKGHETLALKIIPRKSIPIDLSVEWTSSPETSQTLVEVQEPKLEMVLSGAEEVLFGQSKIYRLSVSNPGNGDAENVLVSLLPIGRAAEGSASHKLGLLRAGQSKAIEVELTARQAGPLAIRAQAFADGGLRAEATQQVLVRRANLHLAVDGPKIKYAGTAAVYHIHLTNPGDATAENVQVSAILPPQAKYVSSNSGGRVEADRGKILWSAGSLQPGGERLLEVHCTLQAAGENRVQVLATSDDELSASGMALTRVEALADLKLEIRDPQGPIPVGEDALYEIIIRNRGTKSAENIELVAFFSQGLEATSVQGGAHEIGHGQVVFKTIATLAAGTETVLRVHARAETAGNHVFRTELVCESLQTKLASEETTRFYGEDTADQPMPMRAGGNGARPLEPVPHE